MPLRLLMSGQGRTPEEKYTERQHHCTLKGHWRKTFPGPRGVWARTEAIKLIMTSKYFPWEGRRRHTVLSRENTLAYSHKRDAYPIYVVLNTHARAFVYKLYTFSIESKRTRKKEREIYRDTERCTAPSGPIENKESWSFFSSKQEGTFVGQRIIVRLTPFYAS